MKVVIGETPIKQTWIGFLTEAMIKTHESDSRQGRDQDIDSDCQCTVTVLPLAATLSQTAWSAPWPGRVWQA